jgi:hypothetical protein
VAISDRERTLNYRRRMRAAGFRPVQIWVPDVSRPGFTATLQHQVALLKDQPEEQEALDLIEAVQDTGDWT